MSVQNVSGLASLTATYTDSEGEDDAGDVSSPSPEKSKPSPPSVASPPVRQPSNSKKIAQLVSYHDDTVVSDEEGEGGGASDGAVEVEEEDEAKVEEEVVQEEVIEPTIDGVKLPPEPPGHCSATLQEKIKKLHEKGKSSAGCFMNKFIEDRKDFRNPSIYEKLVQFCGINELGTNYPPEIYDPLMWGKESYYEVLAEAQKADTERRMKERKEKTKVEFVSGTAKRTAGISLISSDEEAKRRKSKWDQVGGVGVAVAAPVLRPIGLMQQPSLTTSATGTKGTVISAFGSLPKKPKP